MSDDSSFEGWTTPAVPGAMDYPTGRKLASPPAKGWVGNLHDGNEASDETNGKLWFLRRADRPEGRSVRVGAQGLRRIRPAPR